jgi:hypothetical protein
MVEELKEIFISYVKVHIRFLGMKVPHPDPQALSK